MMARITMVCLALVLPGLLLAAPAVSSDPLLDQLMKRNPRRNGGSSEATPAGPRYDAFWGSLQDSRSGGVEDTAQEFLRTYGSLLGFPAGFQLGRDVRQISSTRVGEIQTVVYAPESGGVHADDGLITMQFDGAGNLVGISGRYESVAGAKAASIDAGQAVRAALEALQRKYDDIRLAEDGTIREYLSPTADGGFERQFEVCVVVGHPPLEHTVTVGAGGEVLREEITSPAAVPDGKIHEGYPELRTTVKSLPDLAVPRQPEPWQLSGSTFVSTSSFPVRAKSISGHFNFPTTHRFDPAGKGSITAPEDPEAVDGSPSALPWPPFLETSVYGHLTQAQELAILWGADKARGRKIEFDVWVTEFDTGKEKLRQDNAFFLPSTWQLKFLWRNTQGGKHPATDSSVILHEYGHAVQYMLNSRVGKTPWGATKEQKNEINAIQEGFSDFFAASIVDCPHIMRIFNPGGVRSIDHKMPYGLLYQNSSHEWGSVFGAVCWDLRQAIGRDAAARLVFQGMRNAKYPIGFRNACVGLLGAAGALEQGAHLGTLKRILETRGLPEWALQQTPEGQAPPQYPVSPAPPATPGPGQTPPPTR